MDDVLRKMFVQMGIALGIVGALMGATYGLIWYLDEARPGRSIAS